MTKHIKTTKGGDEVFGKKIYVDGVVKSPIYCVVAHF